jgi:plastocyanin
MSAWRNLLVLAALAGPVVAGAAATHVVTIEGMKFEPATVRVKMGDQVVWQNKDLVPHTATAADKFDSGQIAGGKSWSWTAIARGQTEYVCTYHPGMKGSVVVE